METETWARTSSPDRNLTSHVLLGVSSAAPFSRIAAWLGRITELGPDVYAGFAGARLLLSESSDADAHAFPRLKHHPQSRALLAPGAERFVYGGRALTEGGLQSLPQLHFHSGALVDVLSPSSRRTLPGASASPSFLSLFTSPSAYFFISLRVLTLTLSFELHTNTHVQMLRRRGQHR
ncbi:hypothetical protein DFH09DRAFT_1364691 [Mycena vulgaris]|nr:hypothetical protein DFH09DRAFT_1364691 [Mycena vulgaris]